MKYRVFIAGYDNWDSIAEIPYLLKKAGCIVDVFCTKRSWLLKNSYFDNHIPCTARAHKEYVQQFERAVKAQKYDWVVMVDDTTPRIVNEYFSDQEVLSSIVPVSKTESRMMLGSKAGLHFLCTTYGIRSPLGRIYNSSFETLPPVQVPFPLLLKTDFGGGGTGVFLCRDETEVQVQLAKLTDEQKKNLLFQEYIAGDIIGVEALFRNGNVLAYALSVILNNVAGEFSISRERKYIPASPHLEAFLAEIGSKLGLNGFCSMTLMQSSRTKEYYLIEADLRPQTWYRIATLVGVDFSLAILNYLSEKDILIRPFFSQGKDSMILRSFGRSIIYSLEHCDGRELLRWLCNSDKRWKCIPLYDRKFLFATIVHMPRSLLYDFSNLKYMLPIKRLCKRIWNMPK